MAFQRSCSCEKPVLMAATPVQPIVKKAVSWPKYIVLCPDTVMIFEIKGAGRLRKAHTISTFSGDKHTLQGLQLFKLVYQRFLFLFFLCFQSPVYSWGKCTWKELVRVWSDCMEVGKSDLEPLEQFLGSSNITTPVLLGLLSVSEKKNKICRKIQHRQ